MLLQAVGLGILAISNNFHVSVISMILVGIGTALVYPNFLSEVAANTHPFQRAQSLSIFRFWRHSGYVIGAVLSGVLVHYIGIANTLFVIAFLTAVAGLVAQIRMCCTNKMFWKTNQCVELY
jgi:MFS family permease